MTSSRWLVAAQVLVVVIAGAPAAGQPSADASNLGNAQRALRRHHVSIQLEVVNPLTDVIELGGFDIGVERNIGLAVITYRYSLTPFIDLNVDLRYWSGRWPTDSAGEVKVDGGFVGPGIRVHALDRTKGGRLIPYLQGNVYLAAETVSYLVEGRANVSERLADYGVGLGLSGGVDVIVSRLVSVPIEATFFGTVGDEIDNLSAFGLSVGVSISF